MKILRALNHSLTLYNAEATFVPTNEIVNYLPAKYPRKNTECERRTAEENRILL